jgi:hypothetical protein
VAQSYQIIWKKITGLLIEIGELSVLEMAGGDVFWGYKSNKTDN